MSQLVTLRRFSPSELFLTAAEARTVLAFFYADETNRARIGALSGSDPLREFAQGLLVEAIDRSYAMGFVEALFKATANPTAGAMDIIKNFARKALRHWFDHATAEDLRKVKIYEMVRERLAVNFITRLNEFYNGLAQVSPSSGVAMIYFPRPRSLEAVWC